MAFFKKLRKCQYALRPMCEGEGQLWKTVIKACCGVRELE